MSILSTLPRQALLPLGDYDLSELRSAAKGESQRFLLADCTGSTDKDSVLRAIASGLGFGEHFGVNLDALYDCVTDLEPDVESDLQSIPGSIGDSDLPSDDSSTGPGMMIVLSNLPDTLAFDAAERNRMLDVFRDAAEFFNGDKIAFRVFYSVQFNQST